MKSLDGDPRHDRARAIMKSINMGLVLAPADFKAVYSVKAP